MRSLLLWKKKKLKVLTKTCCLRCGKSLRVPEGLGSWTTEPSRFHTTFNKLCESSAAATTSSAFLTPESLGSGIILLHLLKTLALTPTLERWDVKEFCTQCSQSNPDCFGFLFGQSLEGDNHLSMSQIGVLPAHSINGPHGFDCALLESVLPQYQRTFQAAGC